MVLFEYLFVGHSVSLCRLKSGMPLPNYSRFESYIQSGIIFYNNEAEYEWHLFYPKY